MLADEAVQHHFAVAPDFLLLGRPVLHVVDFGQGLQPGGEFLLHAQRLPGQGIYGEIQRAVHLRSPRLPLRLADGSGPSGARGA